jgi:hypothetical protein
LILKGDRRSFYPPFYLTYFSAYRRCTANRLDTFHGDIPACLLRYTLKKEFDVRKLVIQSKTALRILNTLGGKNNDGTLDVLNKALSHKYVRR